MDDLDLGLEERPAKVKGGLSFIVFLVGVAIGVTGTLLVPRYLGPYLPAGWGRSGETIEGPVLSKRQENGRLLLTVQAEQGAALATFSERVAEIDLLVNVGDTVTLGVAAYEPFIDDPAFRGIRKANAESTAQPPAGAISGEPVEPASTTEAGAAGADSVLMDEDTGEAPGDTAN